MTEVKAEDQRFPQWIKIAATVLSVFPAVTAPIFYLCGVVYDQGYLSTYGVDSEFFVRSIQEYHSMAFTVFLGGILGLLETLSKNLLLGAGIIALIFVGIRMVIRLVNWLARETPKRELKHLEKLCLEFIFGPIIFGVSVWWAAFIATAIATVVLFLPFSAFYKKGQEFARRDIEKVAEAVKKNVPICGVSNAREAGCVYLTKEGRDVGSGTFVARSSTHIALFNGKETVVYPLGDLVVNATLPAKK